MKRQAPLLVLVLALAWLAPHFLGSPPDFETSEPTRSQVSGLVPEIKQGNPRLPQDKAAPRKTDQTSPSALRAAVPLAGLNQREQGATVRGRLLFPSERPAMGVELRLVGWFLDFSTTAKRLPVHVEGETDQDGRFEFEFEAPPGFSFFIDIKTRGFASERFVLRWIDPQGTLDLGAYTLRETGAIEGLVVDGEGLSTMHTWTVAVQSESAVYGEATSGWTRIEVECDPQTGAFRIEDLPAGTTEVNAYSQVAEKTLTGKVKVEVGRTASVTLTYAGPAPEERIAVVISAAPYHHLPSTVMNVRISGQGVDELISYQLGSSRILALDHLKDGLYTATIDDERFLPWIQESIRPGESARAKLIGSAKLQLDVRDQSNGEPIPEVQIQVTMATPRGGQTKAVILQRLGALPEGGLLPIVPGTGIELVIKAPGYAPMELSLGDLLPGELRLVNTSLLPE